MSRKMEYGEIKQRRGDFSINMCSIRPIIGGRYHEVRIHPTQEISSSGTVAPLQYPTDNEMAILNQNQKYRC